ncbi:DUF3667 domain-containing protein [Pararhodonellum marinum]|uniref:DUF3667 domain-containing protein n=1 Tax=Pararhodonellum marinum TaxID=2755358 RepID=UPI00189027C9|nr:DUF3667 domain-containing protein [Pararhodonellum marinum]
MPNTKICKNCGQKNEGNFCRHCGQVADTRRLTMRHIWIDLQNGIVNFDKGIFYTIKQLLTRPGHSIREYIEGKRVHHFKPLSFVVVLATIYGLLYHFLIPTSFDVNTVNSSDNLLGVYEKVINWSVDHFAYATLILIISSSVSSFLVFRKQGYNLAEHLVLNTYYRGLVMMISLLIFPVLYALHSAGNDSFKTFVPVFQLIDFVLLYWCYSQFFDKLTKIRSFLLTLLSFVLLNVFNMILALIAGLVANSVF